MPVSSPSTHGCASSRRRPAASASRCANRRTAASSGKRISLRRKPLPSSTQTASGAVTNTSVVPSAHSSGSRMPAPVSSVCRVRRLASTSVSPSIPPDSARIAAATTDAAAGRPAARFRRPAARGPGRSANCSRRLALSSTPSTWRAATASAGRPPRSTCAPSCGCALIAASSGSPVIPAISAARSPPGDGPRTTRPTLGLTAARTGASTTKSAAPKAACAASVNRRGRSQITLTALGGGVYPPGAGSRQHADAAVPRQRIAHRRPIEPAALQRQVRPAQPRGVLAAEQQLDPAAPRVEVHQQRGAGRAGRPRRRRRATACPRCPSSRDDSAASARACPSRTRRPPPDPARRAARVRPASPTHPPNPPGNRGTAHRSRQSSVHCAGP